MHDSKLVAIFAPVISYLRCKDKKNNYKNKLNQLKIMVKTIFELFEKDIFAENVTKRELVIWGVVAPIALIAVCMLAEAINTL